MTSRQAQWRGRAPDPDPTPSTATPSPPPSRPASVAGMGSGGGQTTAQRVEAFTSELRRLQRSAAAAGGSGGVERLNQSYVLLRRCENPAIRAVLLAEWHEEEDDEESEDDSAASPWELLMSLLRDGDERSPGVLAHVYAAIILSAGTFRSEQQLRTFLQTHKPGSGPMHNIHGSASSTAAPSQLSLWSSSWSWNLVEFSHAPQQCAQHLDALLAPLLLSVHPQDRRMSAVLLKPESVRATASLQQLWTPACELLLGLLNEPVADAFPATCSASLRGFTFPAALASYVGACLAQPPLLSSSTDATWRMIELVIALYLRSEHEQDTQTCTKTAAASSTHPFGLAPGSPLWILLAACFRELCSAPCCNCCFSSASFSTARPSSASDPFHLPAASPYVSITSLLFRFVALQLDAPARGGAAIVERIPLLQVLLWHALCFHADGTASSSPLVRVAEYILTRVYFEQSHVLKLLPLLTTSSDARGSQSAGAFVPQLQLYLPPASEQFMAAHASTCAHLRYTRQDMSCKLFLLHPCAGAPVSPTSLLPHAHSLHLLTLLLSLLKKFLLLKVDVCAPAQVSSSSSSGANERVLRDMQSHKTGAAITSALSFFLSDLLAARVTPENAHVRLIEAALLEMYLWNTRVTVRVKELFDLAHAQQRAIGQSGEATSPDGRLTGVDVLYGLGMRVLLCSVDAMTSFLHTTGGGASFLDFAAGAGDDTTTRLGHNGSSAVLAEHVACVVQDIAAVLADARALRIIPSSSSSSTPLQISDLIDQVQRTSHLTPPSQHYPAAAYLPVLEQVHAYMLSVRHRFNPMLATPSRSIDNASGVPSSLGFAPSPPTTLASPRRVRPFSSYTRASPRGITTVPHCGGAFAAASIRSPSYSPPSSANALGSLSPRALIASSPRTPSSSGGMRSHRTFKVASNAVSSDFPAQAPRQAPPPSSSPPRSERAAPSVVPRLAHLSSHGGGDISLPVSAPVHSARSSEPLRPVLDVSAPASARKLSRPTEVPVDVSALPPAFSTQQAALAKLQRDAHTPRAPV